MWYLIFGGAGLALAAAGRWRGRRRAVAAGLALLAMAAWDLFVLYRGRATGSDMAIRVDLVVLLPAAVAVAAIGGFSLARPGGGPPPTR